MNPSIITKLASQITALIPEQASKDIQKNIQDVLARQLNKMDMVSRDDFEAQQAVLLRTREKLDQLEKQVAELERTIKEQ